MNIMMLLKKKLNLVKFICHTPIFSLEDLLFCTILLIIMIIIKLDLMKQTI